MAIRGQETTNSILLDEDLRATWDERGSRCQLRISGRITIDTSPDLRDLLIKSVEANGCEVLTVGLAEVSYVDTSGVAILLETLKVARTRGKTLRLSGLRERLRYLLEVTRLLPLFDEAVL